MQGLLQAIFEVIAAILRAISGASSAPREKNRGRPTTIHDLDHIKKWEQLRLKAYLPTPHDRWTIGWGHTKTAKKGMVISEGKAEALLRGDLKWVEKTIKDLVKVPLTQAQFDALAGLIFNIGRPNFQSSTVLRRLNAYDYAGAADAFLMWNKQRQGGRLVVLRGLTRRRQEERALFLKGTNQ